MFLRLVVKYIKNICELNFLLYLYCISTLIAMSSPNVRICITPNCQRVAASNVAGIGQWCHACFSAHFLRPSIYQTQLPSNLVYPNMDAPLPRPMQIPQLPPQLALNGNINTPLPNRSFPTPAPQLPPQPALNGNINAPLPNQFVPTPPA